MPIDWKDAFERETKRHREMHTKMLAERARADNWRRWFIWITIGNLIAPTIIWGDRLLTWMGY